MFELAVGAWDIVARTALVYVALLVGLRLAGKRQLGQMTPFDLVVILLIANSVQNAMVGSDVSVTGGLIAAAVLLVLNYALAWSRERVPWLRHMVEGTPTLLIHDGKFVERHMRREGIDHSEVMTAIREHGFGNVDDVKVAVLEVDGSISIIPKDASGAYKRTRKLYRRRF